MIRRLTIKNFLALSALSVEIDPAGALIEGGNGRGKTTVLKAIKAALEGAGISPEAVRKGTTAAEILVDLDDDTVRRRITAAGATSIEVEDAAGSSRRKPVAFLSALLDLVLLDPLDLFLAKPAARRALVLRAVPCRATPAALQAYLPPGYEPLTDEDCKGHGLDVVDALRARVAGERVELGRAVKEWERTRAAAEKQAAETAAPPDGWPSVREAEQAFTAAVAERSELEARAQAAARSAAFCEAQRKRAQTLREQALVAVDTAPAAPTSEEREATLEALGTARRASERASDAAATQRALVDDLNRRLREAQREEQRLAAEDTAALAALEAQRKAVDALEARETRAQEAAERATRLTEEADQILEALVEAAAGPTADELAAAAAEVGRAEQGIRAAHEAQATASEHRAAQERVAFASTERDKAAARYELLDAAVKALTSDAPRALLADAAGLTGLTLDGETILVDDGSGTLVDVERLSTAAQMRFALDVAKRLNAKSRLLLVDGLERLDPERRGEFVAHAIEGGYQLFATRVTEGPLQIAPIGQGAP